MPATLRLGSRGEDVKTLQRLLNQKINAGLSVDGDFGPRTDAAVKRFQQLNRLTVDGIVGPRTWAALQQGAGSGSGSGSSGAGSGSGSGSGAGTGGGAPVTPAAGNTPQPRESWTRSTFGSFDWRPRPATQSGGQAITILGGWESSNIQTVPLPELAGVPTYGGRQMGAQMRFHRLAARQLQGMWAAWKQAGLISKVIFFAGSFVPRYKRGSTTSLSNHSWGTAFDINPNQNGFNSRPAAAGTYGSVRELVAIADSYGFYWGGNYNDGMHFEVGRIL